MKTSDAKIIVQEIRNQGRRLSDWDNNFLNSINSSTFKQLTNPMAEKLLDIYQKATEIKPTLTDLAQKKGVRITKV